MKVTNDGFCEPCLGCRPSLLAAGIKLHPLPRNGLSSLFHARQRARLNFIDDRNAVLSTNSFLLFLDCVVNRAMIRLIRSKTNVYIDDRVNRHDFFLFK